jgi:hypothetical protein
VHVLLLQGIRTTGRWYLRQPYFIAKPDHGLGPDHVLTLPPGIEELDLTGGRGAGQVQGRAGHGWAGLGTRQGWAGTRLGWAGHTTVLFIERRQWVGLPQNIGLAG